MAVTMVDMVDKVNMADEFFVGGCTLTDIGLDYDCSRKTVRRCVDEVKEIVDGFEVGQRYVNKSGTEVIIKGFDKDDYMCPILIKCVTRGLDLWPDLPDFLEEYTLVVEEDVQEEQEEEVEETESDVLPVGTKVVICADSKFLGNDSNPKTTEVVGEVTVNDFYDPWGEPGFNYRVQWSDGNENCYRPEDIERYVEPTSEKVEEESADYFVVAPQDSISIIRIDTETGETETRNINKHSSEFQTIREMIVKSQDKATLRQAFIMMDTKAVLEAFSVGRVKVDPEEETVVFVKADGSERRVPEDIAGDIIETVQTYGRDKGEHLVKFLDKLMENPSFKAIEGLYRFMKHNCIEINPDGSIQAWKGVDPDLYSHRSGSLKSSATITVDENGRVYNGDFGKEIRVDRSEVDDDPDSTCSHGLHVGNREYASGWASTLLKVKVQPQDVVAVPKDYNGAKMRTCAYTPLQVVDK